MNVLGPLPPEREQSLRRTIERHGVLVPIAVDPDGEILDGHNRKRIAAELGIDCPEHTVTSDADPLELALTINVERRAITAEKLQVLAVELRDKFGWSDARIAEVLGVGRTTVRRATAPTSPSGQVGATRRAGRDNRHRPARRATREEVARRVEAAAKLWREGYRRDAIGEALGTSHGTVDNDVRAAGIDPKIPREIKRGPAPTIVWRDEPARQSRRPSAPKSPPPKLDLDEPSYRRSDTLDYVEMAEATLMRDRAENRLAWDAAEAARAGDEEWFARARSVLGALIGRLEGLQRVLDSPAEREAARNSMTPAEARPSLRAVGK